MSLQKPAILIAAALTVEIILLRNLVVVLFAGSALAIHSASVHAQIQRICIIDEDTIHNGLLVFEAGT